MKVILQSQNFVTVGAYLSVVHAVIKAERIKRKNYMIEEKLKIIDKVKSGV